MKKRILLFLLSAIMCLSFAACGSSPEPAGDGSSDTDATIEHQSPETPSSPELTIVSEEIQIFNDIYGDPHAVYIAEFKNNVGNTVKINDVTIDINDKNGDLIMTSEYPVVYPEIVNAGESAFIYEEVANIFMDEGLDFNTIDNATLHFNYDDYETQTSPETDVSSLKITNSDGEVYITGKLENIGNANLENVIIGFPVRDSKGNIQVFAYTEVAYLGAGEEMNIDVTCENVNPEIDCSNSKVGYFIYNSNY